MQARTAEYGPEKVWVDQSARFGLKLRQSRGPRAHICQYLVNSTHTFKTNFALDEGAYTPFRVPDNFNVFDLRMFRKVVHEHSGEVPLIDIGRQAKNMVH